MISIQILEWIWIESSSLLLDNWSYYLTIEEHPKTLKMNYLHDEN